MTTINDFIDPSHLFDNDNVISAHTDVSMKTDQEEKDEVGSDAPTIENSPKENGLGNDEGMESDEGDGLFGDGDEVGDEEMDNFLDDGLTAEEAQRRKYLEYEEDEAGATQAQITVATLSLAVLKPPQGTDGKLWHLRMPNFLRIEGQDFDEMKWDDLEEDRMNTFEGGHRSTIPDENVIRWRWNSDETGNLYRQSNARIIEWDDGTRSLQVGKELFDVTNNEETVPPIFPNPEDPPIPPPQLQSQDQSYIPSLSYVVADHEYCQLLEAQAPITGSMKFAPTTIASKAHRKLAAAVMGRHVKVTKTEHIIPSIDPEQESQMKEKVEQQRTRDRKKAAKAETKKSQKKTIWDKAKSRTRGEYYSDEEDGEGEEFDENDYAGSSRRRSARFADVEDESGFIVNSEGEDGEEEVEMDEGEPDDMDEIEAKAEAAEKERQRVKKGLPTVPVPPVEEITVKKKLVIESDDED